jgi:hypothetical protein
MAEECEDNTHPQVDLKIVIPYRDRDLHHMERCVESIHGHTKSLTYQIVVCDYGSHPVRATELRDLAARLGMEVIRSETEGWPWNPSRARNTGAFSCEPSPFLLFLDMDMLFCVDVVGRCMDRLRPDNIVIGIPDMLRPDGRYENARKGNAKTALGGCVLMNRETFDFVGAYDEACEFFASEDVAFIASAENKGTAVTRLQSLGLFHQYHEERAHSNFAMPSAAFTLMDENYVRALLGIERPSGAESLFQLGKPVHLVDRPILPLLRANKTPDFEYCVTDIYQIVRDIGRRMRLDGNGLYRVVFGPRCSHLAERVYHYSRKFQLNRILNHFHLDLKPILNVNYDVAYVALPFLKSVGVRDYYFESTEVLYLLR